LILVQSIVFSIFDRFGGFLFIEVVRRTDRVAVELRELQTNKIWEKKSGLDRILKLDLF